jgi:hypothetical protein
MPPFRRTLPLAMRRAPEERPTRKAVPLFNLKCLRTSVSHAVMTRASGWRFAGPGPHDFRSASWASSGGLPAGLGATAAEPPSSHEPWNPIGSHLELREPTRNGGMPPTLPSSLAS